MAYSGWLYKRTLTDGAATSLSDHTVTVALTSANFSFSNANADGSDIRFAQGVTTLPYWIESYDSGAQTATVWVRVPDTAQTFDVYYGNAGASSESNIRTAFLLGEDWSDYPLCQKIGGRGLVSTDSCKLGDDLFVVSKNWAAGQNTGATQLWVSTDGGASWSARSTITASSSKSSIYVDNDGVDHFYCAYIKNDAIGGGVFFTRSTDSGSTWSSESTISATGGYDAKILRVTGTGESATLLAFVLDTDATYYYPKVYRSTDGGSNWSLYATIDTVLKTLAPTHLEDTDMIVAPNGDILLALEFEYAEGGHSGNYQYRSTDGGATWGSRTEIYDDGTLGSATGSDNESGHYVIRPNGTTLDYIFATDEDSGGANSYPRNVLKRVSSTDSGATWSAPETLHEGWSWIETHAEYNSDGDLVVMGTRRYKGGGTEAENQSMTQVVAVVCDGDTLASYDFSDNDWVQEAGSSFVVNESGTRYLDIGGYVTGTERAFLRNDATLPDDVIVEANIRSVASTPSWRICFRYGDINNHYMADASNLGMNIFERAAGTYASLDADAATIAQNTVYALRITAVGTALKQYVNGVLRPDATDGTRTSGKVALSCTHSLASQSAQVGTMKVRRYVATEPSMSVGAEERNANIPAYTNSYRQRRA